MTFRRNLSRLLSLLLITLLIMVGTLEAVAAKSEEDETGSTRKKLIQKVTTEDVKRFLDPTLMMHRIPYDFQMSFLPGDIEVMTHKTRPWYALNNSSAVWVEIPYLVYSIPGVSGRRGIGDVSVGWGYIVHENLTSRLTTIAAAADIKLPTGDSEKGTGLDTYLLEPALAIVMNPTDVFPLYFITRYAHSFGDEGLRVRSFEFELRSFHILPRGFFLAFLPTLVLNLEQDFNIFSVALGGGRALNRRLSLQGGYVQHVAGEKTFSRGFTVGVTWLWGTDKSTP